MRLQTSYWFSIWRERAAAFDPGLAKLLFAARATASIMLTLLLLDLLANYFGAPSSLMLLGSAVTLFSMLAVNDPTPREQMVTSVLLVVPAAASITVGTLLAQWTFISDGVFVLIIFAAVYVRRFGPRAFALGMLAFATYFIGTLLATGLATLPWLYTGICVGLACGFLMRHVIFPERPQRALKRMLRAVLAMTGRVLDDVIHLGRTGAIDKSHRRALRRHLERLNSIAIAAEGQLERILPGNRPPHPTRTRLALAMLDLELRTERVATLYRETENRTARAHALRALRALRTAVRTRSLAQSDGSKALRALQDTALERAVHNLAQSLVTLSKARLNVTSLPRSQLAVPDAYKPDKTAHDTSDDWDETNDGDPVPSPSPQTRLAIQAAIAGALAIGFGGMISPHRSYWAAIAAFVVFVGTNSSGELLVKSWQRAAGTTLGVVVGVMVGTAIYGEKLAEVTALFACVFLGFYLLRVSYALMIFWITVMIAIAYAMLGFFSEHLLVLRLEETAIGVGAGALVSLILLPISVHARTTLDSRKFLTLLADTIAASGTRLVGGPGGDLAVKARTLDRQFQHLRTSARPLTRGFSGVLSRKGPRRWIRSLMTCRYYAASIARDAQRAPDAGLKWPPDHSFDNLLAQLDETIRALAGTDATADEAVRKSLAKRIERMLDGLPNPPQDAANDDLQREVLYNLGRITGIVATLQGDFGSVPQR